ncbi:uncharacterized protein LOC111635540 [Centruroides sculpturatus]|uniref:uncharacterized protein LOC111635540 n=1 Tax=Centruroides sculpturatus TaxID=218467 RepID=UPI000C6D6020|nr:uncharacterized protein LOC111635540 [Centruroides sculpturatus]
MMFKEWDKKKGNYKPNKHGYWTNAKGRLRSAFCRLSNKIEFLGKVSNSMPYRRYRLKNIEELIRLSDNTSQLPTTMVSDFESILPTEEHLNLSCINNPPTLNGMSNECSNLNNNEKNIQYEYVLPYPQIKDENDSDYRQHTEYNLNSFTLNFDTDYISSEDKWLMKLYKCMNWKIIILLAKISQSSII